MSDATPVSEQISPVRTIFHGWSCISGCDVFVTRTRNRRAAPTGTHRRRQHDSYVMRTAAPVLAALLAFTSPASAQTRGVAVQVNEGKPVPTVAQLQTVLNPGDFVRDILGWSKADPACKVGADPSHTIAIPSASAALYSAVQSAQGKNFVTLAFNNRHCGQPVNSGIKTFPNTDALRAEFAAYAVGVVKQVPALGGVSIWNELNGTWSGGYTTLADKLTNYCLLANTVIAEVRKADKNVPIAIGATVGADIGDYFVKMFDTYGCVGKGDPTIWLDVHPYLSGRTTHGNSDWQRWNDSIAKIRADKITNPLVATEWGSSAANRWMTAHPGGNYMTTFVANVVSKDPAWAGLTWFELLFDKKVPNAGLFDKSGSALSVLGSQYTAAFKGK